MPAAPGGISCMGSLLRAGVVANRTHPPTPPGGNPPVSKRTLAALLALLTFASALAVVASPAAAHSQTKQQCAYDPFAGNQCWTVNVSHTHSCRPGMTGTYPNCYPAPSTNQQNTGDEQAKKAAAEARKKAAEAKRKAAEAKAKAEAAAKRKAAEAKAKAEAAAKRKAEAEARRQRRTAAEEARRRAEAEAKRKAAEAEATAKRKAAEAAAAKKAAEEAAKKCPAGKTGTPPNCRTDLRLCGTPSSSAHAQECEAERKRQKAEEEAKKKAQQEARKPEPCGGGGGEGSTPHHKHGGPCHADTPGHAHPTSRAKCPLAYKYNADLKLCELNGNTKFTQDGAKLFIEIEGQVVCSFTLGGAVAKVAKTVLKGVSWTAKQIWGRTAELVVDTPCDQAWDELEDWWMNYRPDTTTPSHGQDGGAQDGGSGTDSSAQGDGTDNGGGDGDELSMGDVVRAMNERPRAEAEAVLKRYHCQQAQGLPAGHSLRTDQIAQHCS